VTSELQHGRESYLRGSWADAHEALSSCDRAAPLSVADLELLATSAYMLGRDDEHVSVLERAHHARLAMGDRLGAARCAFWMGLNLLLRGEMARATGWLGRSQRLVEGEGLDCVERGFLLIPVVAQQVMGGDADAAYGTASEIAEVGQRFADADLFAFAVHWQGCARVRQGRVEEGLGLLDEAMVAVTAGELSPIVTGLIYCSVIEDCHAVYALARAHEWTVALTQWCDRQPDMVAFTGRCLAHRAEIMRFRGEWGDALEEARRAGRRFALGVNESGAAQAVYQQAELHRLQGDYAAAEEAYREASDRGWEPQPGMALLRLAQGEGEAAAAAIRRVMDETTDPLKRAGLLPAYAEIMLAVADLEAARDACRELEGIADACGSAMLDAMAAHARGAAHLDDGDARAAVVALRRAWELSRELGLPYEAARSRVLLGLACRAVGDEDTAALELEAARGAFERLGAAPDLARIAAILGSAAVTATAHGLSPRELQVLRMVAAGKTNKTIAGELVISDRTVDRHVSNIFTTRGVSSRAAATAYAYEHELV
jgi:DNA-binding CsgD family transcriptional regulator/tetratricopeptide (TPR) repeat protein